MSKRSKNKKNNVDGLSQELNKLSIDEESRTLQTSEESLVADNNINLTKGGNNKNTKKNKIADEINVTSQKTKGNKNKSIADDSDEDEPQINQNKKDKKRKNKTQDEKKKSKQKDLINSDDEEEIQEVKPIKNNNNVTVVSRFQLLEGDSSEEDKQSSEDEAPKVEVEVKPVIKVEETKGNKKSKKKDRKKKKDDDEDIDKILEEIGQEYGGVKPAEKAETPEVGEDGEKEVVKDKKKKKIKNQASEETVEEQQNGEKNADAAEEGPTVKTAAQKKKEKKERERLKKLEQSKKEKLETEKGVPSEVKPEEPAKIEDVPEAEEPEEIGDGKKKKKKKGAVVPEEDLKVKKKPNKKQLAAIQEARKRLKDEEDALQLAEEAKQREFEEKEQKRLEKIQQDKEKKEKKKQKEKERIERLKAEGKYLNKAQKQNKARMEQTLLLLKERGVQVPVIGEKRERAPKLGDRKRQMKKRSEDKDEPSPDKEEEKSIESVSVPIPLPSEKVEVEEAKEETDDVKDAWDVSSSEEEEEEEESVATEEPTINQAEIPEPSPEESEEESDESSSEEESEDESSDESEEEAVGVKDEATKKEKAMERILKRREVNESNRTIDKLRSPVVCVLGHVDTGKTKILDKIRHTNVQDCEAGGITQQIGATMVPRDIICEQCKMANIFDASQLKVPGLLIIDTPGHESFSNLRTRGSSLCDVAILVVDIMHGLEPQTIESINILKQKKTPFVVALNKIDRLYDWESNPRRDVQDLINSQSKTCLGEFKKRVDEVKLQFSEQALNTALYYENEDPRTYVSLVPTSAITGDGMGNLMALLVNLTQSMMVKRLAYTDELQATVLEVKAIPGLGTTIDVILVNGKLREGDTIILAGLDGPIVTQIRSLLMPEPLRELRVKSPYKEYKVIEGSQGVKLAGKDLEKAIAGLQLLVASHPDEVEIFEEEVTKSFKSAMSSIKLAPIGVYVQASTLGSLEALLEFLKSQKITYSGVKIGPVSKRDVIKASIMLEHDSQYAVILAFDVKVEKEAEEHADSLGVKIFRANIIYNLFDAFIAYKDEYSKKKRDENRHLAVFPCKLRILPQCVFNSRDPIVVGVCVEGGIIHEGTPLCVPSKDCVEIGIVTSVEINKKALDFARKGQEVCIKIEPIPGTAPKLYGRHFDFNDLLVSKISRDSIDVCKKYFKEELTKPDWKLMIELKSLLSIV